LSKTVIFIDQPDEIQSIKTEILNSSETMIYSFDIRTHYFLNEKKISHYIGERILDKTDQYKIFDTTVKLWNWFKQKNEFSNKKIYEINLLGMLDTAEFHNFLIKEIYHFMTMLKILKNENPKKIFVNSHFASALRKKCNEKNIEIIQLSGTKHEFTISWDSLPVELKLAGLSFSLPLSRSLINKTKNTINKFQEKFQKYSLDETIKKKIILFLEINPKTYSKIFENLNSNENQIVILNRRKPIIDIDSFKILSKNNIKLIYPNTFISNDDIDEIKKIEKEFLGIVLDVWNNNEKSFDELFSIENTSFWNLIKKALFSIITERISEYSQLIVLAKNIHQKLDISCIIHHNYLGETEKAILDFNSNNVEAIMLQHAYANYTLENTRFDVFDTSTFKDKIALWGKKQKDNLLTHKQISPQKIILSGSPRHDDFFRKQISRKSKNKSVLITTQNFEWTNAQLNTDVFLNLEILFKKIFLIMENFKDVNLQIKLHPARDPYNEFLKQRIKTINPNVQILQSESSELLIANCDVLINIHSELIPSTTMLEALMLKKPVLNITLLEEKIFDYDEANAVYSIFYNDLDKSHFEKILFDSDLQKKLIKNGEQYVDTFLENPGTASENFANVLNEIYS
tara:strand:+ start:5273 stop:7159 length:1887 start_codon:yes stop_codon:yes gene_type:complete